MIEGEHYVHPDRDAERHAAVATTGRKDCAADTHAQEL
jgi:hypothetical protein